MKIVIQKINHLYRQSPVIPNHVNQCEYPSDELFLFPVDKQCKNSVISFIQRHDVDTNFVLVRALDKSEYLMIIEGYFFLFLIETICCDPSCEPSR